MSRMKRMKHEDFSEMLELEALGVLDQAQSEALRRHLEECDVCRAELRELRDTAAMLAHLAPPIAPAKEMRTRILERVRRSRLSPVESSALEKAITASPPRSFWLKWGPVAASLVVIICLALLLTLWREKQRLSAELAQVERTERQLRTELDRERELRALLAAPQTRIIELEGTQVAPHARAKLAYDARTGRAILFATNLPPTPAGKAYQLWFIMSSGEAMPGDVFKAEKGDIETSFFLPPIARNAKAFALTLEPAQGTRVPTGEKYLLGSNS